MAGTLRRSEVQQLPVESEVERERVAANLDRIAADVAELLLGPNGRAGKVHERAERSLLDLEVAHGSE